MVNPPPSAVRVLGVDDFALRKGDTYATLLVDLEARRPLDVLAGRDAEPLAAWLRGCVVTPRWRSSAVTGPAPTPRAPVPEPHRPSKVADAWHLWRNLAEAVEKTVGAHHPCIRTAFATPPVAEGTAAETLVTAGPPIEAVPFIPLIGMLDVMGQPRRLVARTTERYEAVQHRLAAGMSLAAIRRELRLDHSTVRRFARAQSLDELLVKAVNRNSILDAWIMTNPGRLADADADAAELKEIRAACPYLDAVARHVRDFADMMRDLRGDQLLAWMDRVTQNELPALHSLVNGLRRDLNAATAALSSSWSSGQVEGHVTRVKLLKRVGYGRAKLDLLRVRTLLRN